MIRLTRIYGWLEKISVYAQEISQAKRLLIDRLLEQSGQSSQDVAKQMGGATVVQMANVLKKAQVQVTQKHISVMQEVVSDVIDSELDGFFDRMYPIYDKHFSEEDLRNVVAFYDTPTGKRLVSATPALMQDTMVLAQQWANDIQPVIQNRLTTRFREEGL